MAAEHHAENFTSPRSERGPLPGAPSKPRKKRGSCQSAQARGSRLTDALKCREKPEIGLRRDRPRYVIAMFTALPGLRMPVRTSEWRGKRAIARCRGRTFAPRATPGLVVNWSAAQTSVFLPLPTHQRYEFGWFLTQTRAFKSRSPRAWGRPREGRSGGWRLTVYDGTPPGSR